MATDYYEALGVAPDASDADIKSAFRRLAREHHPDATGGDHDSEQRYKVISEAYAVLSDPSRRQQYDAARAGIGTWSSPWGSPFASTIEDIFDQFFGGGTSRQREQTRARRGGSIETLAELTLAEVVTGAKRTVSFERYESCDRCDGSGAEPGTHAERCDNCSGTGQVQQTRRTVLGAMVTAYACQACQGTGWTVPNPCTGCSGGGRISREVELDIEIPSGIDEGDVLRLSGEGEAGVAGGGSGDLYVRLHVAPDPRFERIGDDLHTWADIPMTTAALGGEVTIQTIDGDDRITVKPGTQTGTVFRLRGRGVGRRGGRGRGELAVRVNVVTPDDLDAEQEEMLRKLAALRGEESPEGGGFKAALRRAFGLER